jgi:hypothetical protein
VSTLLSPDSLSTDLMMYTNALVDTTGIQDLNTASAKMELTMPIHAYLTVYHAMSLTALPTIAVLELVPHMQLLIYQPKIHASS